jgi:hypothetical protein
MAAQPMRGKTSKHQTVTVKKTEIAECKLTRKVSRTKQKAAEPGLH